MTHIGKSVVFDGELTSDEDLQIDGTMKGHVHVRDAHGHDRRNRPPSRPISARSRSSCRERLQGSIAAGDRIELTATAKVTGSLTAERVIIAEGAQFNGGVDMGRRTIATKMAQSKAGQTAARA